jgi:hypothetical protein
VNIFATRGRVATATKAQRQPTPDHAAAAHGGSQSTVARLERAEFLGVAYGVVAVAVGLGRGVWIGARLREQSGHGVLVMTPRVSHWSAIIDRVERRRQQSWPTRSAGGLVIPIATGAFIAAVPNRRLRASDRRDSAAHERRSVLGRAPQEIVPVAAPRESPTSRSRQRCPPGRRGERSARGTCRSGLARLTTLR